MSENNLINFCNISHVPHCSVNVNIINNKKRYTDIPYDWQNKTNIIDEKKQAVFIYIKNRYLVIDTDDEEATEYIIELLKKHNIYNNDYIENCVTKSISNVLNLKKNTFHFWFKIFNNPNKHLYTDKINRFNKKIDIKTSIVAEAITTNNLLSPSFIPNISDELLNILYYDREIIKNNNNNNIINEGGEKREKENYNNDISEEAINKLIKNLDDVRADNFESWRNIGFILKNLSNDYYYIFNKFSKRCKDKYNEKQCFNFWQNIKIKDESLYNIVTLGTLIHYLKEDNNIAYKKWINKYLINESKQEIIKEETKQEDDKDEYQQLKEYYEKEWFKLGHPSSYIRIYEGEMQFKSEKDTRLYFKNIFYEKKVIVGKIVKTIKTNFYETWSNDKNIRFYEKIVFEPNINKCNKLLYNLYKGFKYYDLECEGAIIKEFDNLIKHIFKDEDYIDYFYSWLHHIITKPYEKTEKAIVIYSELQGVGKNSLIELIIRLLGVEYTSKISTIDDLNKRFNSFLANKFIIFGDEIKARAKDLSDELKNIISQQQINLEFKGKDVITINDYSNWIFTTNNEQAFNIDYNDRRFFMIEVNNKLNIEDYNIFYKSLQDEQKLKLFFNYIRNYKGRTIIGYLPPMTDYKARLLNVNSVYSYIYKEVLRLDNVLIGSLDLFNDIKEYSKKNYLMSSFSLIKYSEYLQTIIDSSKNQIVKKRTTKGIMIQFPKLPQLLQILKEFSLNLYITNGNHLLESNEEYILNTSNVNDLDY